MHLTPCEGSPIIYCLEKVMKVEPIYCLEKVMDKVTLHFYKKLEMFFDLFDTVLFYY